MHQYFAGLLALLARLARLLIVFPDPALCQIACYLYGFVADRVRYSRYLKGKFVYSRFVSVAFHPLATSILLRGCPDSDLQPTQKAKTTTL
jgi:hypothetical protein